MSDADAIEPTEERVRDFGWALEMLKGGAQVRRAGWNGKGMWLCLMPAMVIPAGTVNARTKPFVPPGQDITCGAYIVMWTAQGVWQPGWLASQADMLAEDWEIALPEPVTP